MQIIEKPQSGGVPIKAWIDGVPVEEDAKTQLKNLATLPFVFKWLAVMPDCHVGKGATVGTVIATEKAIVPAAVGVDIGCGMMAVQTSLNARDLPDSLKPIRLALEDAVPTGRGQWHDNTPDWIEDLYRCTLHTDYTTIVSKHPKLEAKLPVNQLGSLGGGNHFIELCLDERDQVWIMLHSGSRGAGNRIGTYFIDKARQEMERYFITLPDLDLAYLVEGSILFDDYVEALHWAQEYAASNRRAMLRLVVETLQKHLKPFELTQQAINCHHNYVAKENHYDRNVLVTRKGAVSARAGELGIIPGSMGAKSFIVRGKGNPESFCSCSHGAGRKYSRTKAKALFSVADHEAATSGIECLKDESVLDETPAAYKDIDAVMAAQSDLVEVVHTLKQVLCIKGI